MDGETEDMLIKQDLEDPVHYREVPEDPTENSCNRIRDWADRHLAANNITQSMHTYVTKDLHKTHPANPKPLEKHKKSMKMVRF